MVKIREQFRDLLGDVTGVVEVVGLAALVSMGLLLPADLRFESIPSILHQWPDLPTSVRELSDRIPAILLEVITVLWFFGYKSAVKKEIDLIDDAFLQDEQPRHIKYLWGGRYIAAVGYALVISFAVLMLSVRNIAVYCAMALVLHASDLLGNSLVLQNIAKETAKFNISNVTPSAAYTIARREIVLNYYLKNPTLLRIFATSVCTVLALIVALYGSPALDDYNLPYAILILNIVISESIMFLWRSRRDNALDVIAGREDASPLTTAQ